MKKLDDVINMLQANELLNRDLIKKEDNKENKLLWALAIIGAVATVAAIAYAVYRFMTPSYLDDFDDSYDDDYEDDFFDDEEDEGKSERKKETDKE